MCGRFTQTRSWQEIVELYKITEGFDRDGYPEHRYNIAPTQEVATIRLGRNSQGRALAVMRWGLIPAWAEDPRIGSRMINALAETIEAKPAFGAALRERRCLVFADGFYEWQKQLSGGKQPYHVSPAEGPFAFAVFGSAGAARARSSSNRAPSSRPALRPPWHGSTTGCL